MKHQPLLFVKSVKRRMTCENFSFLALCGLAQDQIQVDWSKGTILTQIPPKDIVKEPKIKVK